MDEAIADCGGGRDKRAPHDAVAQERDPPAWGAQERPQQQDKDEGEHGRRLVGVVHAERPARHALVEEGICVKEHHSAIQASQTAAGSSIRNSSGTHR